MAVVRALTIERNAMAEQDSRECLRLDLCNHAHQLDRGIRRRGFPTREISRDQQSNAFRRE
jgi:hypothetical protein